MTGSFLPVTLNFYSIVGPSAKIGTCGTGMHFKIRSTSSGASPVVVSAAQIEARRSISFEYPTNRETNECCTLPGGDGVYMGCRFPSLEAHFVGKKGLKAPLK